MLFFRILSITLAMVALLFGQADANRGQIIGTVVDAKGALVPGAKISVRNVTTGFTRQLTTNESGQYRILQLDAGNYEVTAEGAGFAPSKVAGIVVSVGSSVGINITLQVQAVTTTVEVADSLMNVSPSLSTVINTTSITNLPINGRRFQDFATLTPTVQVEPSRSQLSFAGQRGINSNIMLDGADYNQPFFGGIRGGERSNSVLTVPQSAIEQFQVVTTGYTAEYGRSTGGILNAITKSGTNDMHGEMFYQIRARDLSKNNPIVNRQPSEQLHQYGGAVGAPLLNNRWFYFVALEQQRSDTPRTVLFSQLAGRTATPATAEAFNYFKSQEGDFLQTNRAQAMTARTDYQFKGGHRLTLRYNFSTSVEGNAVTVGGAINPITNSALSNEGTEKDSNHIGTLQYTHLFTPAVINDFKFTGGYEIRPREANSQIPTVTANPIGVFGARSFLPTVEDDKRFQISDGLSISRGAHTMKFGVDFSRLSTAQLFGFNQFGGFTIASSDVTRILTLLSAAPGQNRLDGREVTYVRQLGNLVAGYTMKQLAFYGQDSWRATRNLTFDFGLRWEGAFNPTFESNNTNVLNLINDVPLTNGARLHPTKIANNFNQVMPRFGFAWTPFTNSHRTVVRGHTGIFYAASPMIVYASPTNNLRLPPGDLSLTIAPTATQTVYQQFAAIGVDLNRSPIGGLPVLTSDQATTAATRAAGSGTVNPFAGASVSMMADDFKNPRSFQVGLGFETEVTKSLLVSTQLNYVNTVHLMRNRDYNLPLPTLRATDRSQRPFYGLRSGVLRRVPSLSAMTVRESSARSMYRGATFQAQYRTKRVTLLSVLQNYKKLSVQNKMKMKIYK
ncbi:MAG: TonB-dependent receptor [Candidatus Solibacter usitatus]|nr:TonB-dependent receptor [Candidatus Solibacter usitatus]